MKGPTESPWFRKAWTLSKSGVYSLSQIKSTAAPPCLRRLLRLWKVTFDCLSLQFQWKQQNTNFSLTNAPHCNVSATAWTFCIDHTSPKKKKSKNTRPPVFAAVWWSECRGVPDGTMQPHCHNERITYRANTIGLPFVPWGELKKTGHFGAYLWITSSPPTTVDQADFLGCSRNL